MEADWQTCDVCVSHGIPWVGQFPIQLLGTWQGLYVKMVESVLPLGGHACMLYRPRTTLGEVYKSRLLRFRVAIYLQIYLQFLSIVISRSITNNRQIQSCLLHIYISKPPPQSQLPKLRLFLNTSSWRTGKGLVKPSATWSPVETYWIDNNFCATLSRTKW